MDKAEIQQIGISFEKWVKEQSGKDKLDSKAEKMDDEQRKLNEAAELEKRQLHRDDG